MTLLDSNTIIYLSKELISVDDVFSDNDIYAISVITYMEVLGYNFKTAEEKKFIEKLCSILKIVYIDVKISDYVIKLKQSYKIKLPDAIICATAIINNALLITNDIRLKNIDELSINIIGCNNE